MIFNSLLDREIFAPIVISKLHASRIRSWRERCGLTQADAARKLEVTREWLNRVEAGHAPVSADIQLKLQEILAEDSVEADPLDATGKQKIIALAPLPILSWAAAGRATAYEEIPLDWQRTVLGPSIRGQRVFGIEIEGDSMEPQHRHGDVAVVLAETIVPTTARSGQLVVCKLKDGGALFKLLHLGKNRTQVTLTSYNSAYPPLTYGWSEFAAIHPVYAVQRLTMKS